MFLKVIALMKHLQLCWHLLKVAASKGQCQVTIATRVARMQCESACLQVDIDVEWNMQAENEVINDGGESN